MTERVLKYSVGLFIVFAHFGLLSYLVVLYGLGGFTIDEFTTVLAVVTPVFAGHTATILGFIVGEAKVVEDRTTRMNVAYVCVNFAIPLLLVSILGAGIWAKAHNRVFTNFEELKRFLLLVESVFAVYVGILVNSLYGTRQKGAASRSAPPVN